MKTFIVVVAIIGAAVVGGSVVYFAQKKNSPAPAPVAAAQPAAQDAAPAAPAVAAPAPSAPAAPATVQPTAPVAAADPVDTAKADAASALHKAVDALLDKHITAAQKHEIFQQLIKSGQLEAAIADLKQRALDNPNDPEIPTTLGEAQLNQVKVLHDSGADINEIGILAMQADQSFNAALKIDPANYEAQLVKSISMTYWPADPTRDPQVAQTLSNLIDQQDTMPSNPDYANTYFYLAKQYEKMGQPDQAQATLQLGRQKYPNNPIFDRPLTGQ